MKKILIASAAIIALLGVVPSPDSRSDQTGDGSTTTFFFGFKTTDVTHLSVSVDGTPTTAYSAYLNPDSMGGAVTFYAPPADKAKVRIERTLPLTQDSVWAPYAAFKMKNVEGQLDARVMQMQQIDRKVADTAGGLAAETARATAAGAAEASARAAGDAASQGYASSLVTGVLAGTGAVPQEWSATADGVATRYAVPGAELGTGSMYLVTVGGVPQIADYSIDLAAHEVVFSVAPPYEADVRVRAFGYARGVQESDTTLVRSTGSTTSRTLAARFADVVNVKDYGAKGDGTADDTAAIQAAIDAAAAAGGGTVRLAGKFKITSGLVLKYAVTLYNEAGQSERTGTTNPVGAGIYPAGGVYDAITIGAAGDAASAMQAGIKGISIFSATGNAIVVNSAGATIEGVAVWRPKQAGIVLNSGTTNVLNTHVIAPGRQCFVINHGDNRIGAGSECQQPNHESGGETAGTYDGISIADGVGGTQIYNVRMGDDFYRSRDCIRGENAWDTQITNSDFQNCTVAAIRLNGGHTIAITGSNFSSASADAGKAGIVLGTSGTAAVAKHVAITGSTFNGVVTAGLGAISLDAGADPVTVVGNSFFGNWTGATSIVGTTTGLNNLVEPIRFTNGATAGVQIRDSTGTPRVAVAVDSGNALKLGGTGLTAGTYFNNDTIATGKMRYYQPGDSVAAPGAATINKAAGRSAIAAGASSVVITNNLVTATSMIFVVLQTSDATAVLKNVVPGAGSFTVNLTANATAATAFAWFVTGG